LWSERRHGGSEPRDPVILSRTAILALDWEWVEGMVSLVDMSVHVVAANLLYLGASKGWSRCSGY
jgi:hypothetical protein